MTCRIEDWVMYEPAIAHERYQLLRKIGAGGMGVVYEAEDRERGEKVALKTIEDPDVTKIYQLKREFRVLADLSHPNLVALYDLVVDDGSCFFTMELIDGVDLLAHVWRKHDDQLGYAATTTTAPSAGNTPVDLGSAPTGALGPAPIGELPTAASHPRSTSCDIDRLRAVLPQLARGLHTLHVAGKIHRDVKPSNIRVTRDGRVVLLDFGLVAELERRHSQTTGVAGTVAYMAPEQCAGDVALTPAADWYALGVVLYQALTAKLPFEGAPVKVLVDKQTHPARRPSQLIAGVPRDLDDLCAELLEREPGDRPAGAALLRRLGIGEAETGRISLRNPSTRSRDGAVSGREPELAALERALEPLARGRGSVAVVRAPSGMGKTTLVAHFLDRVRHARPDALVLRGRCLEREDVPYKAIDHLIDELSEWWLELTPRDAQALLPRDACLLPTLFPVLDRVPAIADAPRTRPVADPQARRTHAFDALRETLQRLGDRHTVVLFLDDMQWVDRDTTTLLTDLMRAPDPPPVLFVLATRLEDSEPVLELVRRMDGTHAIIDVGPLPEAAARALAIAQLGEPDAQTAERLVREAEGSPLFLIEMTRYLQHRSVDAIAGKGLDAILDERISELGDNARLIAELVAVAGEPLTRRVLGAASNLDNAELSRQLAVLRAQRVVRSSGSRSDDTIEPYHARVRSAVLAAISAPQRARHHRGLAIALSGKGAAEQLARHWYGAGDLEHAAGYARRAGDEARAKLDFDLSARWYAIALEGPRWTEAERRELRAQLADALADAGRPRDAADQFMSAAKGADASTALELHRRAAGSLLQSGYVAEGLELTRNVLSAVGLAMAKTPMRALLSMLLRRAWLRIRGLGFAPRALGEISQLELTRVDVCEGVSFGLALVDTFRSMDFAARFLLSSLRLGEVWRISRALALEADLLAAMAKRDRATRLLARLDELTRDLDSPAAPSQLLTTRAFIDFFVHNNFRRALEQWNEAITSYRAVIGRAGFELDTVSLFSCWSLYYLGEIGELSRRVPAMAEAAVRSGNRYTAVTLRCAFPLAWLARLEPEAIESDLDAALTSWTTAAGNYQLQHMLALCSRIDIALYRRRPDDVTERIAREHKLVRRAMLDRPPLQALLVRSSYARHAIALAVAAPPRSSERREALQQARRHVRVFRRAPIGIAVPTATMFDGLIAEVDGDRDGAIAAFRACLPGLEQCDTHLFANAVRARLGRLVGGDEGRALVSDVHAWLAREGVREPETMLSMLVPGPT
jgi:serine/threonine protein kinase